MIIKCISIGLSDSTECTRGSINNCSYTVETELATIIMACLLTRFPELNATQ